MEFLSVNDIEDAKKAIASVDCTTEGIGLMAEKAVFRLIRINHVKTKAANILKQNMLSKGGDAAISRHCADLSRDFTDVLLMGTVKQYRAVIPVLMMQPWGLKEMAYELKKLLDIKN